MLLNRPIKNAEIRHMNYDMVRKARLVKLKLAIQALHIIREHGCKTKHTAQ